MREIKFRAWVKHGENEPRMAHVRLINFDYGNILTDTGMNPEIYELMQFTGLKDEYGRELYEGDIVTWDDPEVTEEIFFDNGCFKVCVDGDCPVPLIDALNGLCWVGTKHDNPELLKEGD